MIIIIVIIIVIITAPVGLVASPAVSSTSLASQQECITHLLDPQVKVGLQLCASQEHAGALQHHLHTQCSVWQLQATTTSFTA
jgi:fumarate reductase subunit D